MNTTEFIFIILGFAAFAFLLNRKERTPARLSEMSGSVRYHYSSLINQPMKIYISGKITGLKPDEYMPKFEAAEQALIAAGVPPTDIVNPTKLGIPIEGSWGDAMQTCLDALKPCTAIYMLRDWKDSLGARRELTEAGTQRKDLYFEGHNDIQMICECKKTGVL